MQGFASLPGPDPALPSGSQGSPPCWDPPSVTRMWDVEQETHLAVFFSRQQPLPLIPGCPGSPCALLAVGALSVQGTTPFPAGSLFHGARVRDLGWSGHRCPSSGVAEGERGAQELKHTTLTPEMGGGCFSLIYCH